MSLGQDFSKSDIIILCVSQEQLRSNAGLIEIISTLILNI